MIPVPKGIAKMINLNAPTQNNAQQPVLPNQVPSMTNNIGGIHFGN